MSLPPLRSARPRRGPVRREQLRRHRRARAARRRAPGRRRHRARSRCRPRAEPTSLDLAERGAVVAACARVCADRGAALVVGAGTERHADDDRRATRRWPTCPAASPRCAVVPYYVRPSEAAIVAHFQAVAERSPVPLITYNVPYRTGRGLGAAALLELAATDNVRGLKQAVGRWTPTRSPCWPACPTASRCSAATTRSSSPRC